MMRDVLDDICKLLENWEENEPSQRLARELIFLEEQAKKVRDLAYELELK